MCIPVGEVYEMGRVYSCREVYEMGCVYSCREVYEMGKRAFVSFVHFYYKHECKLIFQAKCKTRLSQCMFVHVRVHVY